VYLWVNGSDPQLLQDLKHYQQQQGRGSPTVKSTVKKAGTLSSNQTGCRMCNATTAS
jgi:hypothetical protein